MIPSTRYPEERRVATVLFADVQGFTELSERMDFEAVSDLIKEVWLRVDTIIEEHGGYIDKHIGDAVMAVWGAPFAHEDDAERAVRAALDMRRALRVYNKERLARGVPLIETGIGITMGEAISGNIGSEQRMDYTVIGDTVNVASRLESLTKTYEHKILINEAIYLEVRDKIPCVDLGFAQVKGKEDSVHIFGVVEPPE